MELINEFRIKTGNQVFPKISLFKAKTTGIPGAKIDSALL